MVNRLGMVQAWVLVAVALVWPANLVLGEADQAGAQSAAKPAVLRLKHGDVMPASPRTRDGKRTPIARTPGKSVILVDGPLDPQQRARLEATGAVLGDYLPDNAVIADLERADLDRLGQLEFVRWVGPFRNEWKVDPELGSRTPTSERRVQLDRDGYLQIVVTLFCDQAPGPVFDHLARRGGEILATTRVDRQWVMDVVLPAADAEGLAELAGVQFIEEAPEGAFRNDTNAWIVQSNEIGQTPVWDAGIHGEGHIVGLIDGTIREDHCQFDDSVPIGPTHRKIVGEHTSGSYDRHGTHVAGTLAGDAGTWGVAEGYDGIAFAARISAADSRQVWDQPVTLYTRLQEAHDDGARIHSNSWGDDYSTAYGLWPRHIDEFSYKNEEDLIVFAVSNGSLLKTPENAKNVLAVAASADTPIQYGHCSGGTGPTDDGRRKPEVYAPGCGTWSTNYQSACDYLQMSGTSMACPVVAGAAVLVRQYFMDGYYPTGAAVAGNELVPTGALMKAVIINSAVDMTGIDGYPSDLEGWGRVLLDGALHFPGDTSKLYVDDVRNAHGLITGLDRSYQVEVLSGDAPLRVTLVYTEPPGSINAADPVINNLDLEVIRPNGGIFWGNWFGTNGVSAIDGSPDTRNNVEQVLRNSPGEGTWTVRIHGTAVNGRRQGYALVITGDIAVAPPDCNNNGIPDGEDISGGTSSDCNSSGVPDECEGMADCNSNGVLDGCEEWFDCNTNGWPDECDIAEGASSDCNSNGVPDKCDLASGTGDDCNSNGVLDDCDVAGGTSHDCNGNGRPDECDVILAYEVSVNEPIPDDDPAGLANTFTIDEHYSVHDVDVTLAATHAWTGDLIVTVSHNGVTRKVIDRPGYPDSSWGFNDSGFDVRLDDAAAVSIEDYTTGGAVVTGTFRPDPDALSVFTGMDAYGDWTINISDAAFDYTGTLDSWGLLVTYLSDPIDLCPEGDCNANGLVDLADFAFLGECLAGPVGGLGDGCTCADFDDDEDVDLQDYSAFMQACGVTRLDARSASLASGPPTGPTPR